MVGYLTCAAAPVATSGRVAAANESTEKEWRPLRKEPMKLKQVREWQRRDLCSSDTLAIATPFAPKGVDGATARPPRLRTNCGSGSPVKPFDRFVQFDVYASPGPLGIIIDTTPEGPAILSVKPASQLLGLVNPGDLIVGLDGVYTRNMTAATFIRLMAKRSQGERKITLLKRDWPVPRT